MGRRAREQSRNKMALNQSLSVWIMHLFIHLLNICEIIALYLCYFFVIAMLLKIKIAMKL